MGLLDIPLPYLSRYGLSEAPYSTKPNERFLYLTPPHREAVAMVAKVLRDREGAALVYGKFGTGKTSLMRRLYVEMRDHTSEYRVALIENALSCQTEFQLAEEVIESFGGTSLHNHRKGRTDQIKQMLFENHSRGILSVLLIDEAHELPPKVLEALRGYLNFETAQEKLLQIVLFAQPPILRRLAFAKAFRDRLWKTELRMMNRQELEEMLRWRFQEAGGKQFPFAVEAIDRLYTITGGHPRSSCGVAQLALELGAMRSGEITVNDINDAKEKRFLEGDDE